MRMPAWFVGEFFGTFLLIFLGCGAVCTAVTTGALSGVFQIAIVWGLAIAVAVHLCGALSGAHINPAVTLSLAVWGDFPMRRVLPYAFAQFLGALVACAALYCVFSDALMAYEAEHGIQRGQPGSEATAMVFGEYFPSPNGQPLTSAARQRLSHLAAFCAEIFGTAILLLVIFCVSDERNQSRPQILTASIIGLTVTMLVTILGPFTMACLNPARDFAPRLFSSLVGWGSLPFQVNGLGWLTVYICAPLVGGLLGGAVYRLCFHQSYAT